jgi:hypothetical protein
MYELFAHRTCDWWWNEAGIFLQLIGAGLLVYFAFCTRAKLKGVADTWESDLSERIRDELTGQAFTGLLGFVFLAAGLLSQLIAGFVQK